MYSANSIHEFYDLFSIQHHFNRIYTFSSLKYDQFNEDFQKNLSEDEFENRWIADEEWKVEDLKLIEENVLRVKSMLNCFNPRIWSLHTNKFCLLNVHDCYESFKQFPAEQNYQTKPELFTRAWIKLYEILIKFNLKRSIFKNKKEINCLFLCEAPGAFITTCNHYIKNLLPDDTTFNWLATTLNPYYEGNNCYEDTLNEDCFIEQTFEKWYFGADNSGDIQQPNFHAQLKKEFAKSLNRSSVRVDLITGDAGIRNIERPELQEINSFKLIMNEAIIALNCLSNGGYFILKIFSFFDCKTISLIYLLVSVFEKVHLFKPISSKEGNSEIYMVCMNYRLYKYKNLVEQVTKRLEDSKSSPEDALKVILFKKDKIPKIFLEKIVDCAYMFAQHQTNAIERNIYLFEVNDPKFFYQYKRLQKKIDNSFRARMQLRPIKIEDQLVKQVNQIKFRKKYYYKDLNRKILMDYGDQSSYEEIVEERARPIKKLMRIRNLIESVYGLPRNQLFERYNKFYEFYNSTSMVLNPDKFIELSKNVSRMKSYANTKLCSENLAKILTDYSELSKPSTIDPTYSEIKLQQNRAEIVDQFRNLFLLENNETTFNLIDYVKVDSPQSLSSILVQSIESLEQNVVQYESLQQFDDADIVLHSFDLLNAIDILFDDEHSIINFLLLKLNEIMDHLKFNHILAITLPSLYSRYAFGLIYLCSCIYRQFAISPLYLRTGDLKSGLILLFANKVNPSESENNDTEYSNDETMFDYPSSPISDLKRPDYKFDENDFEEELSNFKKIIFNCHKRTSKGIQILDILGIHRLMREKEYRGFFKIIISANNLNLIETIKLDMEFYDLMNSPTLIIKNL